MSVVPIRSQGPDRAEVAGFAPLCSNDFRNLGVLDGNLRWSRENMSRNAARADALPAGVPATQFGSGVRR